MNEKFVLGRPVLPFLSAVDDDADNFFLDIESISSSGKVSPPALNNLSTLYGLWAGVDSFDDCFLFRFIGLVGVVTFSSSVFFLFNCCASLFSSSILKKKEEKILIFYYY